MADNSPRTASGSNRHQRHDEQAEAVRHDGEAAAEAFEHVGDTAGEAWRRSAEDLAGLQREFLQGAVQRFEEVSRRVAEAAQGTTEDVRALMVLPCAANDGLQDVQQSVTGLVGDMVRINLRATQDLFQLASPGALVELQQRFAREYVDTLMQGAATLVRAVQRTADEALRLLEQQIEQRRRQSNQRFRHAAE